MNKNNTHYAQIMKYMEIYYILYHIRMLISEVGY